MEILPKLAFENVLLENILFVNVLSNLNYKDMVNLGMCSQSIWNKSKDVRDNEFPWEINIEYHTTMSKVIIHCAWVNLDVPSTTSKYDYVDIDHDETECNYCSKFI